MRQWFGTYLIEPSHLTRLSLYVSWLRIISDNPKPFFLNFLSVFSLQSLVIVESCRYLQVSQKVIFLILALTGSIKYQQVPWHQQVPGFIQRMWERGKILFNAGKNFFWVGEEVTVVGRGNFQAIPPTHTSPTKNSSPYLLASFLQHQKNQTYSIKVIYKVTCLFLLH